MPAAANTEVAMDKDLKMTSSKGSLLFNNEDSLSIIKKQNQKQKQKQKQMSIDFFGSPMGKKRSGSENLEEGMSKKLKVEAEIDDNNGINADDTESEEMVNQEILDLATESGGEENGNFENVSFADGDDNDGDDNTEQNITENSLANNTSMDTETQKRDAENRMLKREQDREKKRLLKQQEEDRKREAKRLKKLEEDERRRLKKEKEEEERRLKREKIEAERDAKREQKEREKAEKQKKRDEESKIREEKKKREEEEKLRRKDENERKKQEKELEKKRIEEEKEAIRLQEEEKAKKRSITNFFKIKPSTNAGINTVLQSSTANLSEANTPSDLGILSNDYDQYFLPFHIKPNVTLADTFNKEISTKWDRFLEQPNSFTNEFELERKEDSTSKVIEQTHVERAINVLQCLNAGSMNEANRLFQRVPVKYLKFYENKRSAYTGTFSYTICDIKEPDTNLKLNPMTKVILKNNLKDDTSGPIINYDYDSDAEAYDEEGEDDDEEGEDLNSADEDDDADDDDLGSSDIDEFVERDQGNGTGNPSTDDLSSSKKRRVIGPLVAVIRNCKEEISAGDEFGEYFATLQWERMREGIQFPIDPYRDYWKDNKKSNKELLTIIESNSNMGMGNNNNATTSNKNPKFTSTIKTSETENTNASVTTGVVALGVKKKVITNMEHLKALMEFVQKHKTFSLNTIAELAVKDDANQGVLGEYSRAVVKNTVKANAVFDKKNGWQVAMVENA